MEENPIKDFGAKKIRLKLFYKRYTVIGIQLVVLGSWQPYYFVEQQLLFRIDFIKFSI